MLRHKYFFSNIILIMSSVETYFPLLTWTIVTSMTLISVIMVIIYIKLFKCITCLESICNEHDIVNKIITHINVTDKKNKSKQNHNELTTSNLIFDIQ